MYSLKGTRNWTVEEHSVRGTNRTDCTVRQGFIDCVPFVLPLNPRREPFSQFTLLPGKTNFRLKVKAGAIVHATGLDSLSPHTVLHAIMEVRERKSGEDVDSLKDKLKVKWHNRDFTPKKEDSDRFTMRFFFAMVFSMLIESVFYLIPYGFGETWYIHTAVVLVLFQEVMINWHRSYCDPANYVTAEMKTNLFPDTKETPAGWKSCIKCQVSDRIHCRHEF